jgi:hypothetical protein
VAPRGWLVWTQPGRGRTEAVKQKNRTLAVRRRRALFCWTGVRPGAHAERTSPPNPGSRTGHPPNRRRKARWTQAEAWSPGSGPPRSAGASATPATAFARERAAEERNGANQGGVGLAVLARTRGARPCRRLRAAGGSPRANSWRSASRRASPARGKPLRSAILAATNESARVARAQGCLGRDLVASCCGAATWGCEASEETRVAARSRSTRARG